MNDHTDLTLNEDGEYIEKLYCKIQHQKDITIILESFLDIKEQLNRIESKMHFEVPQ